MACFLQTKRFLVRNNFSLKRSFSTQLYQDQPKINPLKQIIMQEIRAGGVPMSLARFMELGLSHPQYGYYSTKDKIFNKGGDFTTSPEISQMFGEMIGIWFLTALRNYQSEEDQLKQTYPDINSLNIVEIGPGSGIMMSDILRTLSQFTGNLKNIQVNMIETSPNLIRQQQDRLLSDIQDKMNMFLTYDVKQLQQSSQNKQQEETQTIDKFYNKDQNFSISWYPSLKEYYNTYLTKQVDNIKSIKEGNQKEAQQAQVKQMMLNPCFVLAHELFDALPIHQFEYSYQREWCERVVQISQDQQDLELVLSKGKTENVDKILKPEKLFKDSKADIKVGDSIEICPSAVSLTQEITSLLEVSRGTALIIDYGEDQAFSNSFRGLKEHKLVKDFKEIQNNIGQIDLTSYVNFAQLKSVAKSNKNSNTSLIINLLTIVIVQGPMPQGLFLESMGITMRLEQLSKAVKTEIQKEVLESSYIRLCDPKQMGAIYKVLYLGHKEINEVYPFLGEQTENKQEIYG